MPHWHTGTLAHWHTGTLALAHLHWPTYWKMSFPGQVWGWHSASWATRATTMFTRRRARSRFILIFYFLKEPLNVDFFWSGKKLVKLPLQPRVLVLSQVASLHHFVHFHCYHYDCHHRYHHHYIEQHCGWTPVGQLRILPCYGQRNQIIYDCLHVDEDFQQK